VSTGLPTKSILELEKERLAAEEDDVGEALDCL